MEKKSVFRFLRRFFPGSDSGLNTGREEKRGGEGGGGNGLLSFYVSRGERGRGSGGKDELNREREAEKGRFSDGVTDG